MRAFESMVQFKTCNLPKCIYRERIMFEKPSSPFRGLRGASAVLGLLAVLGGRALAEQDKYTVQVPEGSRSLSSRDTRLGRRLHQSRQADAPRSWAIP